jgi:membrane-bound ClpP family serine protease
MEPLLLWGLVLLAGALLLTIVEIFVPSGGLISLLAAAVAVAGIVCLWRYEASWGVSGLLGSLILLPTVFFGGLSLWTNTDAGRRAMGLPSEEEREARRMKDLESKKAREAVIGKEGVVLTELRPVGTIELEGKRVDALAEVGFIPAGTRVRVTGVDTTEVRVRSV